jgi:hypothetical protein
MRVFIDLCVEEAQDFRAEKAIYWRTGDYGGVPAPDVRLIKNESTRA